MTFGVRAVWSVEPPEQLMNICTNFFVAKRGSIQESQVDIRHAAGKEMLHE